MIKSIGESLSSGGGETAPDLERIIDDPLEAGKGTNHENSSSETLPESWESNLSINLFDLSTSRFSGRSLVQDRDHSVSWMGHNGAENTGNVTGHESNHKLGTLAI